MTEEEVKDLLREASEKIKEYFIPNMTNLLMDVFQHGINKGSELGMNVASDVSKSKSQFLIKWQTGEPKKTGEYLVTTLDGLVDYDVVYKHSDGDLFWGFYDKVIAWCKLSDIKPYKEEIR